MPLVQFLVRDIREKIPETFISKMKMTARDLKEHPRWNHSDKRGNSEIAVFFRCGALVGDRKWHTRS